MITATSPTGAASGPGKSFRGVLGGDEREVPKIDISVAHIARVYDYWLGGRATSRFIPTVPAGRFLVVSHLASDVQPEAMAEMGRALTSR